MQANKKVINAYLFQTGELEALLSGMISLPVNDLCPLNMANANRDMTDELRKLAGQTAFQSAAAVLCQPHLRLSARKGGGSLGMEQFFLLARKAAAGIQWVVLMNDGKASGVLCFPSTGDVARWFAETLGSECQTKARNFLGSTMSLKAWMTAAHALDTFRRLYMESMLVYNPTYSFRISVEDYQTTWQASLESGDVRWLMPAFVALTPGLSGWVGGISPKDGGSHAQCPLMKLNPSSDHDSLELTADGMAAGFEFTSSWMYGVGWEASTLDKPALQTAFLAPTSLANHLFLVDMQADREPTINHQSLTLRELEESLEFSFSGLLDGVETSAARDMQPQPASSIRFCMKCGQKLSADAKFCAKCGSKVESK